MDKRENILEQDIVEVPLLDVYEVYAKYMKQYFETKWWQFVKRVKLLKLLEQFHISSQKSLDITWTSESYIKIWKDTDMDISVNPNYGIVAVNKKLISYEFLQSITDRPMLHQPIIMKLGKDNELVFEKYQNVVGNN